MQTRVISPELRQQLADVEENINRDFDADLPEVPAEKPVVNEQLGPNEEEIGKEQDREDINFDGEIKEEGVPPLNENDREKKDESDNEAIEVPDRPTDNPILNEQLNRDKKEEVQKENAPANINFDNTDYNENKRNFLMQCLKGDFYYFTTPGLFLFACGYSMHLKKQQTNIEKNEKCFQNWRWAVVAGALFISVQQAVTNYLTKNLFKGFLFFLFYSRLLIVFFHQTF